MTRITDEAVEAAAAGAWTVAVSGEFAWETLDAVSKAAWRREARGALEAALPHLEGATPAIDREALLQVVAEYIDDLDAVPPMGTSAEHLERRAVHVTDAVIAHLGGAS